MNIAKNYQFGKWFLKGISEKPNLGHFPVKDHIIF